MAHPPILQERFRFSVLRIILPSALTVSLFVLAIFLLIIPFIQKQTMERKREMTRELAETAFSTLQAFADLEASGELSREAAQQQAIRHVRKLRYGSDKKDYFWINDMVPRMIMHPYRNDLEGKDVSQFEDPGGKRLFLDFVQVVRKSGEGYVDYQWQWKDDPGTIVPKVSYVKGFKPWGWIIGTGIYIEDVKKELSAIIRNLIGVCVLILILVTGISFYIIFQQFRMERERLATWDALQQNEERHRAMLESSPNPIVLYDTVGNTKFLNPAFTRVFGWSLEEVAERKIDFVPPENQIETTEAIQTVFSSDSGLYTFETRRKTKDGLILNVIINASVFRDANRNPIGMVVNLQDITEIRRAEAERLRLFTAIEQAADSIIITDRRGNIEYVNPVFLKVTGFFREDLIGNNFRIFRSDAHEKGFYRNMWRRISSGKIWSGRISNIMKNGSLRQFETTISPVRDAAGNVGGFVSVNRDVTHEVQLAAQLRQAQKMESIGTLSGGIAHDFNNILSIIIGNTEIAMLGLPESMPARANLEKAQAASLRARDVVRQLLSFSRKTELAKKPVALRQILEDNLHLLRASLPSSIEMRTDIQAKRDTIQGDSTQIHQVVINLCTNAAQAMPEGGVLDIGLWNELLDGAEGGASPPGTLQNFVVLSVRDTGSGIDHRIKDRIFDPYFTTKDVGKGTGMGLAVVHGIVQSHEGWITVESNPEKGSVFQVYFPILEAPETPEAKPDPSDMPKGKETILLVDDEELLVDIGTQILEFLGYRVVPFKNPEAALTHFRNQPHAFDLIITDFTMPGMNGIELVTQIRRVRADVPVILCTGYTEKLEPWEDGRLDIEIILAKPFEMRLLAATVRSVIDRNKTSNGNRP
jgi:PAS domain S-box-containing protein